MLSALLDSHQFNFLSLAGWQWLVILASLLSIWVWPIARLRRALRTSRKQIDSLLCERDNAVTEVRDSVVTRRSARYEIELISSLLEHTMADQSLKRLLKIILPHPNDGFAAVIRWRGQSVEVIAGRGQVPGPQLLSALPSEPTSQWRAEPRFPDVFLVPTQGEYFILASQIAPSDIAEETARAALSRCLPAVAERAAAAVGDREEDAELRTTVKMLKLREIAEAVSRDPQVSVQEYLDAVLRQEPFERASLFLAFDGTGKPSWRRVGQAGQLVHSGVQNVVGGHEEKLLEVAGKEVQFLGSDELQDLGINSLLGSAAMIPLLEGSNLRGLLCLTSAQSNVVVEEPAAKLLMWVAEHLMGLLENLRERFSMERRATQDGLTGLLNRAEFDRRLIEATSRAANDSPCCLVLFDLDHFKKVNDNHGHAAGDEAIRHVARTLQSVAAQMRSEDQPCVARYGGEELAILLGRADLGAGLRVAEQVRSIVASTPFSFEGVTIPLTISAGVAEGPRHGQDPQALIQSADTSLYASKRLGRNRVTDATRITSAEAMKTTLQS